MTTEINSKIEDIQKVFDACAELENMLWSCKNRNAVEDAQAGLYKLVIALLKDIVDLYQKETDTAGDGVFEETTTGSEEIIQTAAQIFFSRNGFISPLVLEGNHKIEVEVENVRRGINSLLITVAEELVKAYIKEQHDETKC